MIKSFLVKRLFIFVDKMGQLNPAHMYVANSVHV